MKLVQKEATDEIKKKIIELKKDKIVLESLIKDLVVEQEGQEELANDPTLDEILKRISNVKRIQKSEAEILKKIQNKKESFKEIVLNHEVMEAIKHPILFKSQSLLNHSNSRK